MIGSRLRIGLGTVGVILAGSLLLAPVAASAAKLTGVVWTDADRDGVRDKGERGRGGVRIEVLRAGKGGLMIVRGLRTKPSGAWSAALGPSGLYRARVLLPAATGGFAPRNRGRDGTDSDVAVSGAKLGMTPAARGGGPAHRFDAGLLPIASGPSGPSGPLITIGDFVWRDEDADGIQDLTEEGLGGVAVELWDPAKATLLARATSNAAGYWALPGYAGTSYRVRVPTADLISPLGAGADRGRDSDLNPSGPDAGFSNVFTPGASVSDLDAGLFMAVGDFVWDDLDSNGVQGPGESGIANVTVQLWNAALTELVTQSTTDASGRYRLLVPAGGDYRVRVLLPTGFSAFSPKDAGTDNSLDSDINPAAPDPGFTDPFSFPGGYDLSLDAGLL